MRDMPSGRNKPDHTHFGCATIRRLERSFDHIVHAEGSLLNLGDVIVGRVTKQCRAQCLPIVGCEAKTYEENGFAPPIAMGQREQIRCDLALWKG